MTYIIPHPVKKGDTIGLITPSSPLMPGRLEAGIVYLEQNGFKVKVGRHNRDALRFLAGRDEDRAQDVMDFFKDPEVKAMIATGGGYGSQRILPYLDYDLIRANPKMVIGLSDTTALHMGLLNAGLACFTGFTMGDVVEGDILPLHENTLLSCLMGEAYEITAGSALYPGKVTAPLVGGNLDLVATLIGTPYQPNFKGAILLLEEVRTEPYKIDCCLSQLHLAGILQQAVGIVFGKFEQCQAEYHPDRDGTVDNILEEWSARLKIPCLKDFPYGHSATRSVLPLGKNVTLDVDQSRITIEGEK